MSGCSASSAPNALRWRAWWTASATPRRIVAALPTMQSSRVCVTISMIVATPRPSSPRSRPGAPRNSTSLEASERVPSLSLSRCSSKPGPRSTTKHESPPGACARTRKTAPIGCEQNHLWPVSSNRPSPAGSARVVPARTSEPPCFSVIAMPHSAPRS